MYFDGVDLRVSLYYFDHYGVTVSEQLNVFMQKPMSEALSKKNEDTQRNSINFFLYIIHKTVLI